MLVTARSRDEIEAAAAAIRDAGGIGAAWPCDITADAEVDDLVRRAPDLLGGPIDTLVNNAGVYHAATFLDHELADWQWIMEVNVVATVRMTRAFLPMLLAAERSRLVVVASIAGKKGSYGQSAYNASKHAQVGLVRCLALEHGRSGLRVNAICPGFTRTELIDLDEIAAVQGTSPDEAWSDIEAASTIGRTVSLDEIAALAVYLASPAADGVNGQSLAIDGGITYG